ncbi:protease modulator HflC [Candidatus Lucifugimonas marina]|uniref:Protein HflC n=1 Tax=Candidatus Lucifugimonas marina TaxID=3038979 RepID=A0AAJ5ZG38_9CHLR|nr:protease modulator HflC [SAR202 cluster bacterium JH702]MDG0870677.1 protease modulator HflC [SAR202 cluster bacterium JH639]WFG36621.1 protease modulator HflC [SAR202 cluster bacterium JH545]WFG40554.1 protease modulator HflC [SAR202 cluster bacterium JH1073]
MSKLTIPLIVIIIAAAIIVPQTLFVVDETQLAIVTRFGEFKRSHRSPGLQVKTPFAEQVTRFDKRLLRVDVAPASLLTADKRNLVIDSYARYRIVDPLVFFKNLRNESGADARVGDIVNAQLRQEVAQDLQHEVISETREDIMNRVTTASNRIEVSRGDLFRDYGSLDHPAVSVFVDEDTSDTQRSRPATNEELAMLATDANPPAMDGFSVTYSASVIEALGIEIIDVRIKRADFPPDIETSVFARMEAERERIASGLRAEGSQRDSEIRAEVDRKVNIILETAEGTSALLRGEAEQEAIKILAESLEADPDFYSFRRSLEAYKVFMDSQTTVIIDPESDLLKFLTDPSGG